MAEKNKNGEPSPGPVAKDTRAIVLSIKGTVAYREWVNALAAHNRTTTVNLMDLALVAYARQTKFPLPAPPRNRVKA